MLLMWRPTTTSCADAINIYAIPGRRACKPARCSPKRSRSTPGYAEAHAWLSLTYIHEWNQLWTRDVGESLEPALDHAQKALALDDSLPIVHMALSQSYQWQNRPDDAFAAAQHAVALDPNNADALGALA